MVRKTATNLPICGTFWFATTLVDINGAAGRGAQTQEVCQHHSTVARRAAAGRSRANTTRASDSGGGAANVFYLFPGLERLLTGLIRPTRITGGLSAEWPFATSRQYPGNKRATSYDVGCGVAHGQPPNKRIFPGVPVGFLELYRRILPLGAPVWCSAPNLDRNPPHLPLIFLLVPSSWADRALGAALNTGKWSRPSG